jgi:3-oxoacyl-[acyl-carrier-protein] synthase I
MAVIIESDYIISGMGAGTEANMAAISAGSTALKLQGSPLRPLAAAPDSTWQHLLPASADPSLPRADKMAIAAAYQAMQAAGSSFCAKNTALVVSTTKGNVRMLSPGQEIPASCYLWKSAANIAAAIGLTSQPIVISNACISGVMAYAVALRLINAGLYTSAIVVGVDELSNFILSGFDSFKSLSPLPCKPFDTARDGLSLGEGASASVLRSLPKAGQGQLEILSAATANDANHISGPSRTGEGLAKAIKNCLSGYSKSQLAFIYAHGTATPYNDAMEAAAISASGLAEIPVFCSKGAHGHTLGAAGTMETAIGCRLLEMQHLPGIAGFSKADNSWDINLSGSPRDVHGDMFLKTASGFGGCNAALLLKKHGI